jgi:hypothetical protein
MSERRRPSIIAELKANALAALAMMAAITAAAFLVAALVH